MRHTSAIEFDTPSASDKEWHKGRLDVNPDTDRLGQTHLCT